MRKAFQKNWIGKIASLLLATAIWFLIKAYLDETSGRGQEFEANGERIPRAIPVRLQK